MFAFIWLLIKLPIASVLKINFQQIYTNNNRNCKTQFMLIEPIGKSLQYLTHVYNTPRPHANKMSGKLE